jgi:hypothetical protein
VLEYDSLSQITGLETVNPMKLAVHLLCVLLVFGQSTAAQQTSASISKSSQPAAHAASPASVPQPNILLDGTPVKLRLDRTVSSATAKVGDEVDFRAVDDVAVNGVVVIPQGALALATVTKAQHKRSMGRAGKLNISIDSVRLADGQKAMLRATEGGKGGGHVGAMTGAMVATSIVFFPAAPLFLFMHGKDITIPKGTQITAYIDGDIPLDMARFEPHAAPQAASAAQSQVVVTCNVPDCDIEVDGAFVGDTPSTLSLISGKHQITVQKSGYTSWSRSVLISGSSIHIDAELTASQASGKPAAQ